MNPKRQQILNYFKQVAVQENEKINSGGQNKSPFDDLLNKDDKGRVLFIQPESCGDILLCTALFKSIKNRYPDWAFYVATKPEYKDILNGNPYVDKWIPYFPQMDNHVFLVGNSTHNGFFNVAYHPYFSTQKLIDYYDNSQDKIDLKLK